MQNVQMWSLCRASTPRVRCERGFTLCFAQRCMLKSLYRYSSCLAFKASTILDTRFGYIMDDPPPLFRPLSSSIINFSQYFLQCLSSQTVRTVAFCALVTSWHGILDNFLSFQTVSGFSYNMAKETKFH